MARYLLNDLDIRRAKPAGKAFRLFDGDGLYLYIPPSGVMAWQLRYALNGKDQTATLGKLTAEHNLKWARIEADKLRTTIDEGKHPTIVKRVERAKRSADRENTFATIRDDWIAREARRKEWTPEYKEEVVASLRNHLDKLDRLPIVDIEAPVLARELAAVERRAPYMLEKVRRRLDCILDYAVEMGYVKGNPLPRTLRGAKLARRHFPAITDLPTLGTVLKAANMADPSKGVMRAHLLAAFTAQRIAEVIGAKWSEFALDGVDVPSGKGHAMKRDRDAGNWVIPRERMKNSDPARGPHVVPLPPKLLAMLRAWRELDGPDAIYVCPAPRDPRHSIVPEAAEKFYRRTLGLAGKHSPHSWRSAFSTICREAGKEGDVIEAQLDHVVGNKVAAAYDRAQRIELRRQLVTWYEDMLVAARDGAKVIPIVANGRVHN